MPGVKLNRDAASKCIEPRFEVLTGLQRLRENDPEEDKKCTNLYQTDSPVRPSAVGDQVRILPSCFAAAISSRQS
jgi:hypothetical protein